jgi:hypothetical protein
MGRSGKTAAIVFAGGTCLLAGLFAVIASRHGVNADEGFYVLAGLRVLAGERPYADFFYPQMPYLSFAEALLLAPLGQPSLLVGRLVSVLPGAALGGLLAMVAWRQSGRIAVAATVVAAYAAYVPHLNYLTVTKTYGLSNLAMVGAFLLVVGGRRSPAKSFAAGFCMAVAVGTRLPAVPVAVLLAVWQARAGLPSLVAFACGALAGALPCLWVFAADPDAFWFNNVGFHELRKEIAGLGPILAQKGEVLLKWLLLPQNLVLWVAAFAGLRRDPRSAGPPLACAAALGALYLYATPTYLEYMVQIVPFLLLAALPALAALVPRSPAFALAATIYAAGLLIALRPTPADSERGRKLALWDHAAVHAVAEELRRQSAPGDRILSWWEGYPWLAGREGIAGVGFWESNVARKLSAADGVRYHVAGRDDLKAWVRAGEPRLVVFPEGTWEFLVPELGGRYDEVRRFGAVRVFRRTDRSDRSVGSVGSDSSEGAK